MIKVWGFNKEGNGIKEIIKQSLKCHLNHQRVASSKPVPSLCASLSRPLNELSCAASKCKMSEVIEREIWAAVLKLGEAKLQSRLCISSKCDSLGLCERESSRSRVPSKRKAPDSLFIANASIRERAMKPLLSPLIWGSIRCPRLYKLAWNIAGCSLSFGEH